MDFVYICRTGRNEELRYSLRSLYRNVDVNNVWVVGGKPDWYRGNFIPVQQVASKYASARANLRAIVESSSIPNNFVLMNDDFFITKKISKIPIYHGGSLEEKAISYKQYKASSHHATVLLKTVQMLKENGVPSPLDYSLHVPLPIVKENFGNAVEMGGAIRSVYGNMNRIGGRKLPVHDVKVHFKSLMYPESFDYLNNEHDLPFVSSSDRTFKYLYQSILRQYSSAAPVERV